MVVAQAPALYIGISLTAMNKILPGAILLLTLIALWSYMPDQRSEPAFAMPTIEASSVHRIEIDAGPGHYLALIRHTDHWQLRNGEADARPASDEAVEHLLADLDSMSLIRVVTTNPELYDRMQVGGGAVKLVLMTDQGDVSHRLLIGKQGTDLISTYIRIDDYPEVLAVNKSLVWQVNRSSDGWRQDLASHQTALEESGR